MGKANGNDSDTVDFENYRHVCHKWHYKIAKALVVCLESKNFVPIRNSLIVLTKIIQHFPAIQNLATVIEKRVEKVCEEEKEKRQDLYIKARSYQGQLVSRKAKMMKEGDFQSAGEEERNGRRRVLRNLTGWRRRKRRSGKKNARRRKGRRRRRRRQ